jgi:hypothetical protein
MREEGLLLRRAQQQMDQASEAFYALERAEESATQDYQDGVVAAEENFADHLKRALRSICTLANRLGAQQIAEDSWKLVHDDEALLRTSRVEDLHSFALAEAHKLLEPLSALLGVGIITGQEALSNLLRSTHKILTDKEKKVSREEHVRNAVLPIIQYIFPDATREHAIPGIIKSSKADIAIPSIHTLIEFKLIKKRSDIVAVLDGISADMQNYNQPEWRAIYGVFYMDEIHFSQEELERDWAESSFGSTWIPIVVLGPINRPPKKAAKVPAEPKRPASQPRRAISRRPR